MNEKHKPLPAEFLVLAVVAANPELEEAWVAVYNSNAANNFAMKHQNFGQRQVRTAIVRALDLWYKHGLAECSEVDGFIVWVGYALKHGTIHHGHTLRSADSHQP